MKKEDAKKFEDEEQKLKSEQEHDEEEHKEKEKCKCEDCKCNGGEKCECGEDKECENDECHCEHCHCGDDCDCEDDECECDHCHEEHEHHKHNKHHGHCHEHGQNKASEYLAIAQRLQADFENYRKHVAEQLDVQRQEGVRSVIEVFLPCLDTFKEAKKSIEDETVLSGINMIEEKILDALKTLNVERIETIGQKFNPHLHNVIAVMSDESKDEDVILDEFQAGWMLNGKVIRYAKVIVNKHS